MTWILDWKVDDKTISLSRDSGTMTISAGFGNRFSFIYGDPRKMAEALHEIADTLLQCEHVGYDADNRSVQCKKPGTVRREYRSGDGYGYMPAWISCDEHFIGWKSQFSGTGLSESEVLSRFGISSSSELQKVAF